MINWLFAVFVVILPITLFGLIGYAFYSSESYDTKCLKISEEMEATEYKYNDRGCFVRIDRNWVIIKLGVK